MDSTAIVATDNFELRKTLVKAFREKTFDVTPIADGDETVFRLEEKLPELLLLDIDLPGTSAADIIKYVRRRERRAYEMDKLSFHHVDVVLIISQDSQQKDHPEAQLSDATLTKPVDMQELKMVLKRLTRHRTNDMTASDIGRSAGSIRHLIKDKSEEKPSNAIDPAKVQKAMNGIDPDSIQRALNKPNS